MAYQTTQVPTARSQEQIRKLLLNSGARGVQFSEDFEAHDINIRFAKDVNGAMRTISVSLHVPEAPKPKRQSRTGRFNSRTHRMSYNKTQEERQEQMARATYRALHDWLKAQFVAVEYGLMSFEDVFLSHFEWMIDGQRTTVGAVIKPRLESSSGRLLPSGHNNDDVIDGNLA